MARVGERGAHSARQGYTTDITLVDTVTWAPYRELADRPGGSAAIRLVPVSYREWVGPPPSWWVLSVLFSLSWLAAIGFYLGPLAGVLGLLGAQAAVTGVFLATAAVPSR